MVKNNNLIYKVIGGKIKEIRLEKGWSLERLGEKIGRTKKTVQRYENGEHKITLDMMKNICDALDYDWKDFEAFITKEFEKMDSIEKAISYDEMEVHEQSAKYNARGTIIVYGRICAGDGKLAYEDPIDEIFNPYPRAKGEIIALQVDGESMNKVVCNGDYAIIRLQPDVESGEIAAVIINGEDAMLKRVYKVDNETLVLKPESTEDFEAHTFIGEQINEVKIFGKYIGHITPYQE